MSDYISREETVNALDSLCDRICVYSKNQRWTMCGACPLGAAFDVITDNIPAADVREVKRGRWVKARGSWYTPGGDPVWECSECGKGRHVYGIEHGTYGADVADGQWVSCPNCGAKMEEQT